MNELRLDDFDLFVQIAAARSLSTVARDRNVAASRISRSLSRIETECGLRLVRRTTHRLSLTDEGEMFLAHARRILGERSLLQDSLGARRKTVSGTVRMGVSHVLAEYFIIPGLPALHALHPDLQLDLHMADGVSDMVTEGIDIVVRAGIAPAETLVARQLGVHGRALYAAPTYLEKYSAPRTPNELQAHVLITNNASPNHNLWNFVVDRQPVARTVAGRFRVNHSAAVVSMALAGVGIARINDVLGRELVRQGRLVPVLAEYVVPGSYSIYAAILAERHRAPRMRVAIDYLLRCFSAFGPPAAR